MHPQKANQAYPAIYQEKDNNSKQQYEYQSRQPPQQQGYSQVQQNQSEAHPQSSYRNYEPSFSIPTFQPQSMEFGYQTEEFPALGGQKQFKVGTFDEKSFSAASFHPNATAFVPKDFVPFQFDPGFVTGFVPNKDPEEEDRKIYGLQGIPTLMNDVDEDLKLLMCGKNLSRLGLNLQQEKSIASYFSGVFTDSELDDSEQPEYSLPVCYYLSKPILKLSHIKKFSDNTLFYIFYNMPGEKLQALAAEDLYRRDWTYDPNRSKWYQLRGAEWYTLNTEKWEIVQCERPQATFLTKEDVRVRRPVA